MTEYEIKRLENRIRELWNEKEGLLKENEELKKENEQEKKLNAEIKARFVKCNTCTDEMKDKCLMFSENLCEGERCEELVDLMALVSKSDLQKENEQLKQQIEKMKRYIKACWVEENLNDYSSYITNSSDEFRDFVKELNEEIRNGR